MKLAAVRLEIAGEQFELREITAGEDMEIVRATEFWDEKSRMRDVDANSYGVKLLTKSLVSWSLNGGMVSEEAVKQLPRRVYTALLTQANRMNSMQGEELTSFLRLLLEQVEKTVSPISSQSSQSSTGMAST